uniref:uncharacterized protein LOC124072336 n=1 Tax=Scatophagus argus TaxID=75038 RepID=UPI001ED7E3C1|nr:uncharacterized protein LOC124072336 [Scatophagus argus]
MLSYLLLFFFFNSTVKSWNTTFSTVPTTSPLETTNSTSAEEDVLSFLQLVATPDYPVAAGQKVNLHCSTLDASDDLIWSWQRLENQTWKKVGSGRDVTLTEPEQSGLYSCCAEFQSSRIMSSNHTVYIVAIHATVGEKLGTAAFILSILALIINLAIVFWLGWKRPGDPLTTSNTVAKGFPTPEKSPKGDLPKIDNDGDVYINYTHTNSAYTDLDTTITEDNLYSVLS